MYRTNFASVVGSEHDCCDTTTRCVHLIEYAQSFQSGETGIGGVGRRNNFGVVLEECQSEEQAGRDMMHDHPLHSRRWAEFRY